MNERAKAKKEPRVPITVIQFMDVLNQLDVGESQLFTFNNQQFVMVKVQSNQISE